MRVRVIPVHNHDPLTVRSSPGGSEVGRVNVGTEGEMVSDPRNGQRASARGETHTWVRVAFDDGTTGFVAQEHLR